MNESRAAPLLAICLLSTACWSFGGGAPEVAEDPDAAAFAARIQNFYGMLEGVPIAAISTHTDPRLRGYFTGRGPLQDYMASLTTQVRLSLLRDGKLDRFEIVEFRLLEEGEAVVELLLVGQHERGLHFWDVELRRIDHWRRIQETWTVSPDRL
jgi:hypothetical protein